MNDMKTLAEILAGHVDQWILIGDPQTTEQLKVEAGRVLFSSRDRDEVYQKAIEMKPKRFAVLYSGETPADMAIVL